MSTEHLLSLTKEKLTHDLRELVAFPTVTGQPEGFRELMAFIQEQISSRAHVKVIPNNGEPILLASNRNTKEPDVCYLVHGDVVSALAEQFTMTVEGDIGKGRGVSDMKYSIPVGYALLNDLIARQSDLTFMLVVTSDEERGGFKGAGYLADTYELSPKLLIVPDGGDGFVVVNKSKGVCQLKVSMEGKPAHSSMPWLGENALAPVVKVASQLLSLYEESNAEPGWHTTMNLGTLHGGSLVNQVTPEAQLGIDFRFPPEQDTVESLTKLVTNIAADVDSRLKVEVTATGVAPFTDPNLPVVQLFLATLSEHLGRPVEIHGEHGSNDARHFNKHGIPYLMTKPEGGDIHGNNEYIDLESVMVFYRALSEFLKRYEDTLRTPS